MAGNRPNVALVLTGGGARAAYQVGVLRALSELLPSDVHTPFSVICGTSAGAINAAVLAMNAGDFRRGVRRLMTVWKNFRVRHVYRADPWGAFSNSARWISALITGGAILHRPVSLLDNAPLATLLGRHLDFPAIQSAIDAGHLTACAITCSGYTSGQSVTFFQGVPGLQPWQRARRVGVPMPIAVEHLLASSALPFIFPPVHINREYFGDGSMRQIAPVSPALHLGADRLLVIGVGRQLQHGQERLRSEAYPSLAQIAGHALNSIFLDSLEVDLERLQRVNRTIEMIPPEVLERNRFPLHHVDFRVISPSEELERIATAHVDELPRTIRALLYTVGALRRSGANLLSYLLFEKSYCRALIRLGYQDTMERKDDLLALLGWQDTYV
ncbi:MAG: patatin-like phospholipase family protein [Betaproteobacteria bacterium]|nr:patatin-like phospholipase family protein [Betaproteobacteria bacterium]